MTSDDEIKDEIKKLSPTESNHERLKNYDEIPDFAPFGWANRYLEYRGIKRSDRTYSRWRNALLTNCSEYQRLAITIGLENNFLNRQQIQLLEEFGWLVNELGSIKLAIAQYNLKHPNVQDQ